MIPFNFNRFGKLVRWSLANDKRYYVKSFMQVLVTLLLVFLIFTLLGKTNDGRLGNYGPCAFIVGAMMTVTVMMGPAFMFYSMEGKHDMLSLLMLPASNLEKYLMRYSTWIILVPLYVLAFLAADLLQYLIHGMLGHDYATFVVSVIQKFLSEVPFAADTQTALLLTVLYFHSLYALGATFFRSHKFNWILTTVTTILIFTLLGWILPHRITIQFEHDYSTLIIRLVYAIHVALILLNFWLSYRLFCRNQVIGKYVNL